MPKQKYHAAPTISCLGRKPLWLHKLLPTVVTADIRRFFSSDNLASICDAEQRGGRGHGLLQVAESESESAPFITWVLREPVRIDSSPSMTGSLQVLSRLLWEGARIIKSEWKRHQCSPILLLQKKS